MDTNTITLKAPAKINGYLAIVGRRDDGYHDIESYMQTVGLYDLLTFRPRGRGIRLVVHGADLPTDRSNLVMRAATLLQDTARKAGFRVGGAEITLAKNIPIAAGLGGGSSDAAATLIGLNRLWRLPWRRRLARLSATLGSDLPFFFHGPSAWVTGRGERVAQISPPKRRWVVLVDPQQPVSTKWAYDTVSRLGLATKPIGATPCQVNSLSADRLLRRARNDMEAVTLSAFPRLRQIKRDLAHLGSNGVLMSGSGAVIFGLFDHADRARFAASVFIEKKGMRAWAVRVLRRPTF